MGKNARKKLRAKLEALNECQQLSDLLETAARQIWAIASAGKIDDTRAFRIAAEANRMAAQKFGSTILKTLDHECAMALSRHGANMCRLSTFANKMIT